MTNEIKYCECCGQKTMIYKRNLRKALIEGLQRLNKKNGLMNWREIGITDFKILKFWDFIYTDETKKSNIGITEKGISFLKGEIEVPKSVFVYNNEINSFSNDYVDIFNIGVELVNKEEMLENARPMNL